MSTMDHVVRDECYCLKQLGSRIVIVDNCILRHRLNLEYVETLTKVNKDEVDGWKEEKSECDVT